MKLVLTAALLLAATTATATTFEITDKSRHLEVIDVVDAGAIDLAQKLDKLSQESTDDVTILINSPGGYIAPGFVFVDAIEMAKSRGVKIKCVSGMLAASMAFIMLAHCDERYVLPNTMLLFHPVSFGGDSIRITEVLPSLQETERRERLVGTYLMKAMGLEWKQYHPHNFAETLWTGKGLAEYTKDAKFLTVVDEVVGTDKTFVYRVPRFSLFGEYSHDLSVIPSKLRGLYE